MTLQLSGITRLLNTKYILTKLNGLPRLPNLLKKKKKSSFQNTPKGQKPLGEALLFSKYYSRTLVPVQDTTTSFRVHGVTTMMKLSERPAIVRAIL